ncbi:MAG: hypothetical protein RR063_10510 [Anaerovoracaceae bacterium]
MILPKKQLSINESLFGFGAYLLQQLNTPITIDDLWVCYKDSYTNKKYSVKFSFDQFVLALDYLYIIGAIRENERGLLCYEANQFKV